MLIGFVWIPFGTTICVLVAKQKNLNVSTYGWAGATYSALFLVPWIYLILRMCGLSMSNGMIYLAYALLYAVWVFAVVMSPILYEYSVVLLIVSLLSLVASLILLIDRYRSDREYDAQIYRKSSPERVGRTSTTSLPHFLYILPFILLFIWLLLVSLLSRSEVSVLELLSPLLLYTGGLATLLIIGTLILITVNVARK